MGCNLSLVVPGLFGPGGAQETSPAVPSLETLLARASRRDGPPAGFEATLCALFHLSMDPERDLPIAPVTLLVDTGLADTGPADAGAPPSGWWLRADPICLQADRERLVLFDSGFLGIEQGEADALVAEINRMLGGEGWSLQAPHPERWYLRLTGRPLLQTTPMSQVMGRDVWPHLPQGEDARAWQARLTEVQMLMHTHPVNQAREASGRMPINSLWLWGGGELPPIPHADWAQVWSHEPLARGLAALGAVGCESLPGDAQEWLARCGPGQHLMVLDDALRPSQWGERGVWAERLARWDRLWFGPLLAALKQRGKQRRLMSLTLYSGAGAAYRVHPSDLWRWWRPRRPLAAFR
jgi:hypothetical protein